jgi:hypothetical protein
MDETKNFDLSGLANSGLTQVFECAQEIKENSERNQKLLGCWNELKAGIDVLAQEINFQSWNIGTCPWVESKVFKTKIGLVVKEEEISIKTGWHKYRIDRKPALSIRSLWFNSKIKSPEELRENDFTNTCGPEQLPFEDLYNLMTQAVPNLLQDMREFAKSRVVHFGANIDFEKIMAKLAELNPALFVSQMHPYSSEFDQLKRAEALALREEDPEKQRQYLNIIQDLKQRLSILPDLDSITSLPETTKVDPTELNTLLHSVDTSVSIVERILQEVDKVGYFNYRQQLEQE